MKLSIFSMASSKLAKYPWPSTVNVANFVSVRLSLNKYNLKRSIDDYKIWREQMLCLLESQDLLGFVDGEIPPPLTPPEQKLWRRTDRLIKGWILGSITGTNVLDAVVGLEHSRGVWLELEHIFEEEGDEIQSDSGTEEDGIMENGFDSSANARPDQGNAATGKDSHWYLPLYRAAVRGDWEEAKKFLDKDPDAIAATITIDKNFPKTILHIAVEAGKSNDFVRKLLEYPMPSEAMLSKDARGNTALHYAATVGNKEAAKLLVNKSSDLLYITNNRNQLPVHSAVAAGHRDTLEYLIKVSKKDVDNSPFVGRSGVELLNMAIHSEFIDVALDLVRQYPDLATLVDEKGYHPLAWLAPRKFVFPSGESFSWWQNWIYSRIPLTLLRTPNNKNDNGNSSSDDQVKKKFDWFRIITFLVPGAKSINDKKMMHQQAIELVKCLCRTLESLPPNDALSIYRSAIIMATREGVYEVVKVIIEMFPNALYTLEPKTGCTIFHVAAKQRAENIFNLVSHLNDQKQYLRTLTDDLGNNLMHMCGEPGPPHKLNLIRGAALQMQRELQWFKEMEKIVSPSHRTWLNKAGKTPQMLFTEKHQELKSQGQKWMKDTATSCTIVATLIAIVMFAANFTVLGGVHNDFGIPIFLKETSFIIFVISDSVSMFTSTTSLLMFLSILTSGYAEEDFMYVLPKRLCIGLLTLFASIAFMMIAFSATIYITIRDGYSLFLIPVGALACLPVTSFVLSQFPLLIAVIYSIYGPGIFGKKSVGVLY